MPPNNDLDVKEDLPSSVLEILQGSGDDRPIDQLRREVFAAFVAKTAEDLTGQLSSERERAIALANWIGQNWRNVSLFEEVKKAHTADDPWAHFAYRCGGCGNRCEIFVRLAEHSGLTARRFSIFNFGRVGGGHSVVQVLWDKEWHLFDVTYAGWFEDDGRVLSWDGIRADPARALNGLHVIKNRNDRYGRAKSPSSWAPVDNEERMRLVWTESAIHTARSFGFVDGNFDRPITLYGAVDGSRLEDGPIQIGEANGSSENVLSAGVQAGISELMARLGWSGLWLEHVFEFSNLRPGETYFIEIMPVELFRVQPDDFLAIGTECNINSGSAYRGSGPWVIEFHPNDTACSILVRNAAAKAGHGMSVDYWIFGKR